MRDDYKMNGPTEKVQLEIEKTVAEVLRGMEIHSKLTQSEIANTALKRFIAAHKDFMPTAEELRSATTASAKK